VLEPYQQSCSSNEGVEVEKRNALYRERNAKDIIGNPVLGGDVGYRRCQADKVAKNVENRHGHLVIDFAAGLLAILELL
jgi:hypothetical protein